MKQKSILVCGASAGAFAVILGAFGAHTVEPFMSTQDIAVFETANKYHFYHALVLLLTGIALPNLNPKMANLSVWGFLLGVFIFSGSLYFLSVTELIFGIRWNWLGAITPIGGLLLIAGWIMLAIAALRKTEHKKKV